MPAAPERPNILWVMSEDLPPLTGAYGDPLARTPHTDALAADGVLFENAYSTSPVCAPSRFSVITGMDPGACAPGQQMEGTARVAGLIPSFAELMRAGGYYATNNVKTHYNCDYDPQQIWDVCSRTAHWRDRPPGVPFLACVMPQVTHESAIFTLEVTRVQPDQVTLPRFLPDDPDIRADFARYYTAVDRFDAEFGQLLAQLDEDGVAGDTIVIWTSDHGGNTPRTKRFCYDAGLHIPMVIRIPPRWQHLSRWAPGTRVTTAVSQLDLTPTLLSIAGLPIPGHMDGHPLLGSTAAAHLPGLAFSGRNRMDERLDIIRTVADERFRYIRNYSPHRPWGQHYGFMWSARGYQAWEQAQIDGELTGIQDRFWGPKPFEELYDRVADAEMVRDLAGDPAHAGDLARLSAALDAHLLAVGDQGFLPEHGGLEGIAPPPGAGVYPLRELLDLTAAAARRNVGNMARFTEALADDRLVIRYWAIGGLLMLVCAGQDLEPAALAAVRARLSDDSIPVRVLAAETLGLSGEPGPAIAALSKLAAPEVDWQHRLQAIDALTTLTCGPALRPQCTLSDDERADVRAAVAQAREDDQEYVRGAARYLELILADAYTPQTPVFDWERFWARIAAYIGTDNADA